MVMLAPGSTGVVGQSRRAALNAANDGFGPHSWPSGMISRCRPPALLIRFPNQFQNAKWSADAWNADAQAGLVGNRSPPWPPARPSTKQAYVLVAGKVVPPCAYAAGPGTTIRTAPVRPAIRPAIPTLRNGVIWLTASSWLRTGSGSAPSIGPLPPDVNN